MWKSMIAVSLGASLGALLRWVLGIQFNNLLPSIPPGTLIANLFGSYIIGLAIAYFTQVSNLAPEWRLFIITGFCGGVLNLLRRSGYFVGTGKNCLVSV